MKRTIAAVLSIGFYLTGLVAQCADEESKEISWQKLWDRADRMTNSSQGHAYNRQWLAVQNTYWPAIAKKCMPQLKAERVPMLRTVLVIDDAGTITDFLPSPDSEAVQCFKSEMLGKTYPKPPESPFYIALKIGSRQSRH